MMTLQRFFAISILVTQLCQSVLGADTARYLSNSDTRFFREFGERITDKNETTTDERRVGQSVSMSDDGYVIAVSGIVTETPSIGYYFFVKVFTLIDRVNGNWTLKGLTIQDTNNSSDYMEGSKAHVCLSGDGEKLAVSAKGIVKVYDYNSSSNQWDVNSIMHDEDAGMGLKASLDTTGSMIAIGIPDYDNIADDAGQVKVCNVGNSTSCRTLSDESSSSKNIGADVRITGNSALYPCIVWGAPNTGRGSISVLCDENNSGDWTNRTFKDDEEFGEFDGDEFGRSVAMSADGKYVAAGAAKNDGLNGLYANVGSVRVFEFNASSYQYERLGLDIDGERGGNSAPGSEYYVGDASGFSIDLSDEVSGVIRVVIGAPNNPGADLNSGYYNGHVRLYEWAGSSWEQVLHDLNGTVVSESFGHSVAMNRGGTRVVVGSPDYGSDSGDYYAAGAVMVYGLADLEPSETPSQSPSMSPSSTPSLVPSSNPSNPEITVAATPVLMTITGFNTTGLNETAVIAALDTTLTESLAQTLELASNEQVGIVVTLQNETASRRRGLQASDGKLTFIVCAHITTRNPDFIIAPDLASGSLSNATFRADLVADLSGALGESVLGEDAVAEIEVLAAAFQIKTNYHDYDFEGNTTWCLTATDKLAIGFFSYIKVKRCNPTNELQMWKLDDLNQLQLVALNETKCIKSQSLFMYMDLCLSTAEDTLSWSIANEKGGQVIKQSKSKRTNYVGIEHERIFAKVRLYREESTNDSLGSWEVVNGYAVDKTGNIYQHD